MNNLIKYVAKNGSRTYIIDFPYPRGWCRIYDSENWTYHGILYYDMSYTWLDDYIREDVSDEEAFLLKL